MDTLLLLFCLIFAYLSGCINPAYYAVRLLKHKDLRQLGSGTLGTRNVYRNFGFSMAVPIFLFDLFKLWPALAVLPVMGINSDHAQALVILTGIMGHIYPVQLHFNGGKGLATFMGATVYILLFNPQNFFVYVVLLPVVHAHLRRTKKFKVKYADTDDELEQIFVLNYMTFVEEIPQHEKNSSRTLKDKFHANNTYIVCKHKEDVVGMVSFCTVRPFSLDAKIGNIDQYIPTYKSICEIRLLAIKKEYRHTKVFSRLLSFLIKHILKHQIEIAVISGTTRQLKLYEKLGFRPFHTPVGKPGAMYQPMYITPKELRKTRWLLC